MYSAKGDSSMGIGRGFLNYSYQNLRRRSGTEPRALSGGDRVDHQGVDLRWPVLVQWKILETRRLQLFPKTCAEAPPTDLRLRSSNKRELHMGGKNRAASEQRLLRPVPRADP